MGIAQKNNAQVYEHNDLTLTLYDVQIPDCVLTTVPPEEYSPVVTRSCNN